MKGHIRIDWHIVVALALLGVLLVIGASCNLLGPTQ